jgi:V8-like Glu-specific endopeptidase
MNTKVKHGIKKSQKVSHLRENPNAGNKPTASEVQIPVRIPHDNLSYSTLISINEGKSTGSGFRLKIEGKNYLITAKHVLYDRHEQIYGRTLILTCHSPDKNATSPWIFSIDLQSAVVLRSKTHDVVAILIGENKPIDGFDHVTPLKNLQHESKRPTSLVPEPYVDVIKVGDGFAVSVDIEALGKLESISLASDVYLMGYPTSLGMRNNQFYDFTKPLIRKGIVAGFDISKSSFVIDCFSFPGNSGGPVVEHCADGFFRVVGVVSKYIPYETKWHSNRGDVINTDIANSGYTVCVAMDEVISLFKKTI